MAQPDTGLLVRFDVLGREETQFKSWEIDSAYLVSTDGFRFVLYRRDREKLRDLELQPVELLVNGASQVLGRIDMTSIGDDGSVIECEGRDYIADLVECNVDPSLKVAADTDVDDAIKQACAPCGIQEVTDFTNILTSEVRAGVKIKRKTRRRRKRPLEDYKPKPGEGIYEYCLRLIARHGATIQPHPESRSELVIDSPDYTQTPLYTLRRTDDPETSTGNNIITATARRDYSKIPTFVLFTGTAAKSAKTGGSLVQSFNMLDVLPMFASDELMRIMESAIYPTRARPDQPITRDNPGILYRMLYHRDTESRTDDELFYVARRALAERLKDSLSYTCTVKGHTSREGAVYSVNTIASVDDAVCGVHEPLWIMRRTLKYDEMSGATTELELVRPGSFLLSEEFEGGS